jgi:hypothetical protein
MLVRIWADNLEPQGITVIALHRELASDFVVPANNQPVQLTLV